MTRGATLAGYAVILLALAIQELLARRHGGATLGRVVASLKARPPARWLLLAAWLWLGWHLFARVDWR